MQQINRKKLIVSADDFGKSKLANKNILELAEAGKLNRVSVMANGKFSQDELSRLLYSGVKLDVHLDTEEWLEDKEKIRESFIKRSIIFWNNHLFGILRRNKKEKIWENQLRHFIAITGENPDGINTHRYDHLFPRYFPRIISLAKKYKVSRIRFGKIIPAGQNGITSAILDRFQKRDKDLFLESGLISYDYCVSLDWIENPEKFFEDLPEGKIELVCHPEREEEINFVNKYL
ncbi:MAG: ChbG/HpnK family deacetylase [Parcubacteria group bacterium]|jgi:predicted glycoside hydrolase/deacetylase ChbG (UPF0249 family)